MKVLIAARVSTADKGQDPETQVEALKKTADRQEWEVVGIVIDKRSAFSEKEAAKWEKHIFDELIRTGADILMVWAMDRLTRRGPRHALGLITRLETHHGVQFFSLQEPIISTATADPMVRDLLISLFAWLGKTESEKRSERLVLKAESKRNRANAIGQRAKWGKGKMATGDDVLEVWRLKDEGGTLRSIADAVDLSKSSIDRILKAPRPVPMEPEGQGAVKGEDRAPSDGVGLGQGVGKGIASKTQPVKGGVSVVADGPESDNGVDA